ncbi:MAG: hypothetical protein R2932_20850 [Caldilineaceae bacterium]
MKKLLIVDDEADLLAELQPMLARAGYQVLTAPDGEGCIGTRCQKRPT